MRACAHCGGSLEGRRSTAKYCSTRCRTQATRQRQRGTETATAAAATTSSTGAGNGGTEDDQPSAQTDAPWSVAAAVVTAYEQAGEGGTATASIALSIARRLDDPATTGAASLFKELNRMLAELEERRGRASETKDPLDLLAERLAGTGG